MNKLISVVMPAYNAQMFIANAINSIRNQTYKDWELIIVDDGSTDKTSEVVKLFQDERIKYFWQPHQGIVAARNYGNSLAQGEYIAMQDSDDLSLPDRLEKSLPYLDMYDVFYHGIYVNYWDKQYQCITREYKAAQVFDGQRLLQEQYIPGVCIFKKELWQKYPFREETKYAFDWMMHIDWVMHGAYYGHEDTGLYEYVRQQNSASITYEKNGERAKAIEKIKEIIKNEYTL